MCTFCLFCIARKMDYQYLRLWEGRGAMARAWSFGKVAAYHAVSNPAWCRIFWEISCISPLNLDIILRCCVLGEGTLPSSASLDSGDNEYLLRQILQCVREVQCAELATGLHARREVEIAHKWAGPVTRGVKCKVGWWICGDLTSRSSRPSSSRAGSLIDGSALPPGSSHVRPGRARSFYHWPSRKSDV